MSDEYTIIRATDFNTSRHITMESWTNLEDCHREVEEMDEEVNRLYDNLNEKNSLLREKDMLIDEYKYKLDVLKSASDPHNISLIDICGERLKKSEKKLRETKEELDHLTLVNEIGFAKRLDCEEKMEIMEEDFKALKEELDKRERQVANMEYDLTINLKQRVKNMIASKDKQLKSYEERLERTKESRRRYSAAFQYYFMKCFIIWKMANHDDYDHDNRYRHLDVKESCKKILSNFEEEMNFFSEETLLDCIGEFPVLIKEQTESEYLITHIERDIRMVMDHGKVSREQAIQALEENNEDPVDALAALAVWA